MFHLENEVNDYVICLHLTNLKLTYQNDKSILSEFYISLRLESLILSYSYESVSQWYKVIFNLQLKQVLAS
jgi:hypothetical protein